MSSPLVPRDSDDFSRSPTVFSDELNRRKDAVAAMEEFLQISCNFDHDSKIACQQGSPHDGQQPNTSQFPAEEIVNRYETLPATAFPKIPGYEIQCLIARGGMGIVFKAQDLRLNRPTAIKMIQACMYHDPAARIRFEIEAEAVAQLTHPHIVSVYEFGQVDGLPFFALEYVGGGTLASKLARDGKMAPKSAAIMAAKLASAVAVAHQKGIVHRDLKPANILLTEQGEPKVTDFGLAKIGQSNLTVSGVVMGTPSYMSPEQAAGKTQEVGIEADIYAIGATLYEMLTGQPPYRSVNLMDTIQQILTRDPARPKSLEPSIPQDLETICLKCLAKDPRNRYTTAEVLGIDLGHFLAGEPTLARPVRWPEQLRMWIRRNPVISLLTLLVVTSLGLLAAVGWFYQNNLADKNLELQAALKREETITSEREQQREFALSQYRQLRRDAYLSSIRNAAAEAEQGRLTDQMLSIQSLDNEEDLRGFEWYYLDRLSRKSRTWGRHQGPVTFGMFTDDGSWAVSVAARELRIWDARSGTISANWTHSEDLSSLATVSPDGCYAATTSLRRDEGVLIFTRGNPVPRLIECTRGQFIFDIGFATGHRIYVRSTYALHVLDAATGQCLKTISSSDPIVHVLNPCRNGQSIIYSRKLTVEFDSAHAPTPVDEYEFATDREIKRGAIPSSVKMSACSIDGKYLIYTSDVKEKVLIWDIAQESNCSSFTFPGGQSVKHLARLADGCLAASTWSDSTGGGRDIAVAIWNPRDSKWESSTLTPPCLVQTAQFLPDGSGLLIAGMDSSVVKVSLKPLASVRCWSVTGQREAWALAISPDSRTIVTGGDDCSIRIWNAGSGERIAEGSHYSLATKAVYAPSGEWFATAGFDRRVIIRDSRSGSPLKVLNHGLRVRALAVSADSRLLAATGDDGLLTIWDFESGSLKARISGSASRIHALTFTRDGEGVLASLNEKELVRVSTSSGNPVKGHESNLWLRPSCLTLSPDGNTLAVGFETGQIVFLNADNGQELRRASAPYSRLNSLAFAPDGKSLASGSVDGSVRLWHVGTATELFAIQKDGPQINEVAFAPDGAYLAATRHDGRLLIWSAK